VINISIVSNARPCEHGSDGSTEVQRSGIFFVPFTSAATLCLSRIFEYSLAGEDGVVTVFCEPTSVKWIYHLYGEDREFVESLNARIQRVMQSAESINAAFERAQSGEGLTQDEILDGVIAEYAKQPITMESFRDLLYDLYSEGALSWDETGLVSRWGGIGIQVVAQEFEEQFAEFQEENAHLGFSVPDLLELFLRMIDRRIAEGANNQEVHDEPEMTKQFVEAVDND
jgi:hypothetical protein